MSRVHNFNAGPAALPLPVLERAQREMVEFEGSGMSLLEHSHRGKVYEAVHNQAIALLRELVGIGDEYEILFLQGGASLQFAMLAMNLLHPGKSADYLLTGVWSKKALSEAKLLGKPRVAADTAKDGVYTRVPRQDELSLDPEAAYVHMTTNNTIFGTQWHYDPEVGSVPLLADMSSDFLWKPFDIKRYGMVYAGAQKNIGPSGLAVVVMRKDLIAAGRKDIPVILRYDTHAENQSLYNTPNTFAIYMVRNVLEHVKGMGGLAAVEKTNRAKAKVLYDAIDGDADFWRCPVEKDSRSTMNVVWRLPTEELEERFVKEATKAGFVGLKGHRSAGGIRASIYNAAPEESVAALVEFMAAFRKSC
ncbi:MAG: 3-phosphoserine/phosphohydroxythreonine transaminase [Deltaproteobacteria bacterium]|nr:3-phosphoserine/phosphohydroxythreonine transaminase [Deltaproteobacteria bacterium]